jgi:hypothetical protein
MLTLEPILIREGLRCSNGQSEQYENSVAGVLSVMRMKDRSRSRIDEEHSQSTFPKP